MDCRSHWRGDRSQYGALAQAAEAYGGLIWRSVAPAAPSVALPGVLSERRVAWVGYKSWQSRVRSRGISCHIVMKLS